LDIFVPCQVPPVIVPSVLMLLDPAQVEMAVFSTLAMTRLVLRVEVEIYVGRAFAPLEDNIQVEVPAANCPTVPVAEAYMIVPVAIPVRSCPVPPYLTPTAVPCQVPVAIVPIEVKEDKVATPVVATLVPTLKTNPVVLEAVTVSRFVVPHKVWVPVAPFKVAT
jgi:hypothetical protein